MIAQSFELTPSLDARREAVEEDAVAVLVADRLAAWGDPLGAAPTLDLVYRTGSHGGTLLFRVSAQDGRRRLAAKVFGTPHMAALEFRIAQELSDLKARIARPLRCDSHLGLVVSEWIDGETLGACLLEDDPADALADAGRWLRGFHREAPAPTGWTAPPGLGEDILHQVRRRPPQLSSEHRREFDRALDALEERVGEVRFQWPVRLHGDFQAENLLLSPTGVVGIDLMQTRPGSRFEDLARMTVQLDMMREVREPGFNAARAQEAFLEGYDFWLNGFTKRLAIAEGLELLRRWYMGARARSRRPRQIEAVRSLLGRRGWLPVVLAAVALGGLPGTRPCLASAACVAAA